MTRSNASAEEPIAPADAPPVDGLDREHLSRNQLVGLALASYVPPVGLASVPALVLVTAGNGSWLGALIAAVATSLVGLSVIAFARRYVVTGSIYSYLPHVFGPWARILAGAALVLGWPGCSRRSSPSTASVAPVVAPITGPTTEKEVQQ